MASQSRPQHAKVRGKNPKAHSAAGLAEIVSETVRLWPKNHLAYDQTKYVVEQARRRLKLFDGSEEDWEQQPLPDGRITVGIDGGYVRATHKQGWFEVIAGRSVVAFRRGDESDVPSAKCFGYLQTFDEKPRASGEQSELLELA